MRNLIVTFALLVAQLAFPSYSSKSSEYKHAAVITDVVEQKEVTSTINTDELLAKLNMYNNFDNKARVRVTSLASKLDIQEEWLYKVFYLESRGFTTSRNPYSGAVGLIQFTPKTARILGTTAEDLFKMSAFEQLEYVEKYLVLASHGKHIDSFDDLYLSVFSPAAIGMLPAYVIGPKGSKAYKWNHPMDVNRDSTITVRDVSRYIASKF